MEFQQSPRDCDYQSHASCLLIDNILKSLEPIFSNIIGSHVFLNFSVNRKIMTHPTVNGPFPENTLDVNAWAPCSQFSAVFTPVTVYCIVPIHPLQPALQHQLPLLQLPQVPILEVEQPPQQGPVPRRQP